MIKCLYFEYTMHVHEQRNVSARFHEILSKASQEIAETKCVKE